MNRFGRRPVLVFSMSLTAAMSAAALAVPATWGHQVTVALATVAKFGASAAWSILVLQVTELFPTPIRNTAMGACSLSSRLGGVLAPVVTNLEPELWWVSPSTIQVFISIQSNWVSIPRYVPWLLFAISSLVAGVAGLFLPETVGRKLPETVEDAEDQELDDVWLNKINAVMCGKRAPETDKSKKVYIISVE